MPAYPDDRRGFNTIEEAVGHPRQRGRRKERAVAVHGRWLVGLEVEQPRRELGRCAGRRIAVASAVADDGREPDCVLAGDPAGIPLDRSLRTRAPMLGWGNDEGPNRISEVT
jgi:hypothetical protein